ESQGLDRALRIEMTLADAGPPAGDGNERRVETRPDLGHLREHVGVAGEVDTASGGEDVAERGRREERGRARAVLRTCRSNDQRTHGELVSRLKLGHVGEAAEPEKAPDTPRNHDAMCSYSSKRANVEVVGMHVRDERCVELPLDLRGRLGDPD